MSVLGAGIGATAQTVSDVFGFAGNAAANKTNLKIAREAQVYNEKMWNKTNEYNSPSNQVKLYREAGINPAFVFGSLQGNSQPLSAVVPSPVRPYQFTGLAQAGSTIQQALQFQEDLKLHKKQVENETIKTENDTARMQTERALADSTISLNGKQMDNLTQTGQQIDAQTNLLRQQYQQNRDRFDKDMKLLDQQLLNSMAQEIGIKIDNQTKDWMLANLLPLQKDLLNKQITYQDLVCKWYDKISDSQVFANRKSDLVQWLIGTFGHDIEEKVREFFDDSKGTTKSYQSLTDDEKSEYALEFAREMRARRNRGENPDAKKVSERIKARILARHKKK